MLARGREAAATARGAQGTKIHAGLALLPATAAADPVGRRDPLAVRSCRQNLAPRRLGGIAGRGWREGTAVAARGGGCREGVGMAGRREGGGADRLVGCAAAASRGEGGDGTRGRAAGL